MILFHNPNGFTYVINFPLFVINIVYYAIVNNSPQVSYHFIKYPENNLMRYKLLRIKVIIIFWYM